MSLTATEPCPRCAPDYKGCVLCGAGEGTPREVLSYIAAAYRLVGMIGPASLATVDGPLWTRLRVWAEELVFICGGRAVFEEDHVVPEYAREAWTVLHVMRTRRLRRDRDDGDLP